MRYCGEQILPSAGTFSRDRGFDSIRPLEQSLGNRARVFTIPCSDGLRGEVLGLMKRPETGRLLGVVGEGDCGNKPLSALVVVQGR